MIASLSSIWNSAQPVLAGLKAGEWALLLVLGVTLVVLSALRCRCLLLWSAGWVLLAQHLSWPALPAQIPARLLVTADVLLGLSMLLIAFGEARARGRRLQVLRALTESIVLAQQQGGMMEDALEELQLLTRSKAAWFRLIEGGHLVATHAVGVSADFLREASLAELTESASQMLERGKPVTAHRPGATPEDEGLLRSEKLHYLVMVPVLRKKSPIGVLVRGSGGSRKLTAEELVFLATCGRQLGIAIENF